MQIEHVALYVNDLEKIKNFFVTYFEAKSNEGYHNVRTDFRSYFLSFDDGARLEIMNKPNMNDLEKNLNRTGYAHIAFSVGSKDKVDSITAHLKVDGYEVISGPRTTGDGYYESCIIDIEGNQIEITARILGQNSSIVKHALLTSNNRKVVLSVRATCTRSLASR